MVKFLLFDELHLTVQVPAGLPRSEYRAIRQTLDEARFTADLRRGLRKLLRRYPSLAKVRVKVTR